MKGNLNEIITRIICDDSIDSSDILITYTDKLSDSGEQQIVVSNTDTVSRYFVYQM